MEKPNIVTVKSPKVPIAEAYRTLRTNIQFSFFDKKYRPLYLQVPVRKRKNLPFVLIWQ